jgi:hypothetical protein
MAALRDFCIAILALTLAAAVAGGSYLGVEAHLAKASEPQVTTAAPMTIAEQDAEVCTQYADALKEWLMRIAGDEYKTEEKLKKASSALEGERMKCLYERATGTAWKLSNW